MLISEMFVGQEVVIIGVPERGSGIGYVKEMEEAIGEVAMVAEVHNESGAIYLLGELNPCTWSADCFVAYDGKNEYELNDLILKNSDFCICCEDEEQFLSLMSMCSDLGYVKWVGEDLPGEFNPYTKYRHERPEIGIRFYSSGGDGCHMLCCFLEDEYEEFLPVSIKNIFQFSSLKLPKNKPIPQADILKLISLEGDY